MNQKIKFRESFRPFAPSCLRERVQDYFELDTESPYMLLVAPISKALRLPATDQQLSGIEKLKVPRSNLPAITHVDYSARVQTVDGQRNPRYYKIIKAFEKLTGCGVIINTSFNIRGEPVVCKPEEAYRCFMLTDMDALVLENFICLKENQVPLEGVEEYKNQFKLD
jgi:carbamoyltransferase